MDGREGIALAPQVEQVHRGGRGEVVAAEPVKGDGVQVTVRISVEIEGSDKPGCVVDTISRLYFD